MDIKNIMSGRKETKQWTGRNRLQSGFIIGPLRRRHFLRIHITGILHHAEQPADGIRASAHHTWHPVAGVHSSRPHCPAMACPTPFGTLLNNRNNHQTVKVFNRPGNQNQAKETKKEQKKLYSSNFIKSIYYIINISYNKENLWQTQLKLLIKF